MKPNPDLDRTKRISYKILGGVITLVVSFNLVGWLCQKYHFKQDSIPEEALEFIIEKYTGLENLDLTPDSPEPESGFYNMGLEVLERI